MKKPVKEKVKAKAKAVKQEVKGKLKGKTKIKASVAMMAAILSFVLYEGCSTATPASRATTAQYRIEFSLGDAARSNTVTFTFGDGALASADSAGSTETQTATPTVDVKPDIDVHYNDAIAGATTASKGVLETLLDSSANKVLALMQSKETGTVEVEKTDGTKATVKCENGQCSFCEDCVCTPTTN